MKITGATTRQYPLYFLFVVLSSLLACSAAYPTVRLGNDAEVEDYTEFLDNLRNAIPNKGSSHGIPVLPASASGDQQYVMVEIQGFKGKSITFALNTVDLYLVAFRSGNEACYFVDKSNNPLVDMNVVFRDAGKKSKIGRGDYDHLESVAGERRGVRSVGVSQLIQAVTNLEKDLGVKKPNVQERTRQLLIIIQMISEAARFKTIENTVTSSSNVHLSDDLIDMENNWATLSKEIQQSSHKPYEAKHLALLKYYGKK